MAVSLEDISSEKRHRIAMSFLDIRSRHLSPAHLGIYIGDPPVNLWRRYVLAISQLKEPLRG